MINSHTKTTNATLIKADWSDWKFIVGITMLVLVIATIPYLYAYYTAPPDEVYMGVMINVPDHGQYFSWMRELTYGYLSANKLTSEPNKPVFFNLLWFMLGRLDGVLGIGFDGAFQLLRIVSTILFLLMIYRLCTWYFDDLFMRRTAFLIITFTSGFGWFLIVIKYIMGTTGPPYPLLVFAAEGNTFFSMMASPHFIGAALYIFVFDIILVGQSKEGQNWTFDVFKATKIFDILKQYRYAIIAGVVALFFGWQHAYDLVLVYGILGIFGMLVLIRDRKIPWHLLLSGIILALISWWPALYSVILTSLDPMWEEVLAQFANADVFTPALPYIPILMGITFILALLTAIADNPFRLVGRSDLELFLIAWFWGNFLLLYIPTDFQIHMFNGWQVPIGILATQGLFKHVVPYIQQHATKQNWQRSAERIRLAVVVIFIILIIPTNVYLFLWRFIDSGRYTYPLYFHQDDMSAMAWLETNGNSDDVVLSSIETSTFIPAYTGKHVFLAHWAQTIDYFNKHDMVMEFFNHETSDERRHDILQTYSVDYLFFGPAERSIGDYNPQHSSFLEVVYELPKVTIYQVNTYEYELH